MSYPNIIDDIETNRLTIEDVRETCEEEQVILKNDILSAAKNISENNSGSTQEPPELLTQNVTRAMGDFWFSIDGVIPPGGLPHLGHLVERNIYSEFFTWISDTKTILTDEEWLAYAESHDGCCPFYSFGNGTTTFRTPKYDNVFLKTVSDITTVGVYEKEGLPNITGWWKATWNTANRGFHGLTAGGCFYDSYPSYDAAGRIQGTDSNNAGTRGYPWFDASRSNAIYGSSDHVTPKNLSFMIGVYAVGAIVPVGTTDAEKIMSGISNIETVLLPQKIDNTTPHIIEKYQSGTSWYRIWSDGWIEQGGQINGGVYSSPAILTFHKAFIDTNYTISAVVITTETGNWTRTVYLGVKGNTNIKVVTGHNGSGGSSLPISWYACGY